MPEMKSSSEAPGHFRKPVCFLPSLAEIIIGPDVLIHLLKELLQGLRGLPGKILDCRSWPKPLDHGLNDNFIEHYRRLCSQTQKTFGHMPEGTPHGLACIETKPEQ
jgi:hypothetical protein